MKRPSLALVSYSSSDSEDVDPPAVTIKKRKLPALSQTMKVPAPVDNPALHQGRVRSSPHVDGQYAAHVYVSLALDHGSHLERLLGDVLAAAKSMVPILHGTSESLQEGKETMLHVSLSRPVYLRAYQREELKRAVKRVAETHRVFKASFATFSELTNDEHTRTFLTMEIGAGHIELRAIADALSPTLKLIRQKSFYTDPRFHASIAWALLDRSTFPASSSSSAVAGSSTADPHPDGSPPTSSSGYTQFDTIPCFPPGLILALTGEFGSRLASPKIGTFEVSDIHVKIGKEVFSWPLSAL